MEQRWKASGSVADEAAFLRCQARRGDLVHKRAVKQGAYRLVNNLHLDTVSRLPQRQAQAILQAVLGTAVAAAGIDEFDLRLPWGFESFGARGQNYGGVVEFVTASLWVLPEAEMRQFAARAVAPWSLGREDPLIEEIG